MIQKKEPATATRTIWMRPSQLKAIITISKKLRVSQAELLREGVDFVIKKYENKSNKN